MNLEKEIFKNTCYWREKYIQILTNSGSSFHITDRVDTIIRGVIGTRLHSINEIDNLSLIEEAKIKPDIIKATLHDFIGFVKGQIKIAE